MRQDDSAGDGPLATAIYREVVPPPALREHLVCLWTHRVAAEVGQEQRVFPDACADILWIGDGEPVVAGPATRPVVVSLPPGTCIVGARFRPGAAAGVLRVDAAGLQDRHLPLGDVSPALARRFSTAVADRAAMAEKLAAASSLLAGPLADTPPPDRVIRGTVRWLAANPHARVEALSRALHVSSRQLQRRLLSAVGYTPKTLHRILRFQRLLALAAAAGGDASLSALALRAGYADQAHMTRDLGELAGRTPAAVLTHTDSALRLAELFG